MNKKFFFGVVVFFVVCLFFVFTFGVARASAVELRVDPVIAEVPVGVDQADVLRTVVVSVSGQVVTDDVPLLVGVRDVRVA